MKNSIHDIDLIERYFENNMSDAEVGKVKERLENDSEFQKLFNREKLLINTIRYQAAQQDLNYLKQLERSLNQNKVTNFHRYWYYFAAAACVGLIALAVLIPSFNRGSEPIFEAYFKPFPNIFEPNLRSNTEPTSRTLAFLAYDQGDYKRASALFAALIKEKEDPGMLMLLGNSNLMLEKTKEAKENFMDLIVNYNDLDLEAKWYLGLCYLKTAEIEQARNVFTEISRSENSYSVKASEVLEKLR